MSDGETLSQKKERRKGRKEGRKGGRGEGEKKEGKEKVKQTRQCLAVVITLKYIHSLTIYSKSRKSLKGRM